MKRLSSDFAPRNSILGTYISRALQEPTEIQQRTTWRSQQTSEHRSYAFWDKPTTDPLNDGKSGESNISWHFSQKKISFLILFSDGNLKWWICFWNPSKRRQLLVLRRNLRERNACNAQQKMNWQNRCQRLIEIGIMCGDKPWPFEDRKTVSLLYLSIGVE